MKFKNSLKIENLKLKISQRGEIVTVLTLLGGNLSGFFMGKFGKEIQKQSQSRQHQTDPDYCPYTNIIKIDHNSSNLSSILTARYAHIIADSNSIVNTRESLAVTVSNKNPAERFDKIEEIILR